MLTIGEMMDAKDLSLRECAKAAGMTAMRLSDLALGKGHSVTILELDCLCTVLGSNREFVRMAIAESVKQAQALDRLPSVTIECRRPGGCSVTRKDGEP